MFVKNMKKAKTLTERQMRRELDAKLQKIRIERLLPSLGNDIIEKVRYFGRKYRQFLDNLQID